LLQVYKVETQVQILNKYVQLTVTLNISLGPGVDPEKLTLSGVGSEPARPVRWSVKNFQWERSRRKFKLDIWGRATWGCTVRFSTKLSGTSLPDPGHSPLVLKVLRVYSLARLGRDLVLLLVVQEVAARPVRAVAGYPVLLTALGLVLVVLANISHLLIPMGKLAEVPVETLTLLFEVPADFCLKPGVRSRWAVRVRGVSRGLILDVQT